MTRSLRRIGRQPTGIDRVERAYLAYLGRRPEPLFALARTRFGYVLVEPKAISGLLSGSDGMSCPDRARAESALRPLAAARCPPWGLAKMLARHLPAGTAYLNVGHSNLTGRVFDAVRDGVRGRVSVLLHDTIPLDLPELQRPGTPDRFRAMIARVQANADLLICNSRHTRGRIRHHMRALGPPPPAVVAPLGVTVPVPDPAARPIGLTDDRPYFVALGTIEPRKNHALLLDIWEAIAHDPSSAEPPLLILCGARGWRNETVFARLDRLAEGSAVREVSGLGDGAVAALLAGAHGLLFPSLEEGFGLPPVEAAALGVPVISSDIPAVREVLGDIPIYASLSDPYQWRNAIESLARDRNRGAGARRKERFQPPSWADHFNSVLSLT